MAVAGAIAARTRAIIPVTWDALAISPLYGDGLLRATIDSVKERILGTNAAPGDEDTLYSAPVIDYLAKLSVLELIPAGIDFWMNEPVSVATTGTSEQTTYSSRVQALQDLRRALIEETRKLQDQIEPIIGVIPVGRAPRASINTLTDDFLTPSPQEFPRPYSRTAFS